MLVEKVLETKGNKGVLTIPASATLRAFVKQASAANVGALPAVNAKGQILGIISERDLLRLVDARTDLDRTTVAGVMTKKVAWVSPKDDINKAMDLMVTRSIRHLPVIAGGKILGLITVRDIMRAMRTAGEEDIRYLIDFLQESMKKEPTSL
mgnify:CR=1 FL=1